MYWNRLRNRFLRERARMTSRCPVVTDRREFFDEVCKLIKEPVVYLEFGVWQGASIRYWLEALPKSRLFGFDSFEGLPETWRPDHPKGKFSTDGRVPDIVAPNLEFVRGWFEDTLEPWKAEHRDLLTSLPLLTHIDSDLYAPARLVLEAFKEYWKPGTIVMFDEYWTTSMSMGH